MSQRKGGMDVDRLDAEQLSDRTVESCDFILIFVMGLANCN